MVTDDQTMPEPSGLILDRPVAEPRDGEIANYLQSVIVAEIFMRLEVHYGIDSLVNEPKLMALVSRF